jgi:hypothetical protein
LSRKLHAPRLPATHVPVGYRGQYRGSCHSECMTITEATSCRTRTTAFTCRAGCKERDVSKNRNAGPVKCNALFGPLRASLGLAEKLVEQFLRLGPSLFSQPNGLVLADRILDVALVM